MDHEDAEHYVLTERGMRFLAARAGVTPGTFGKYVAIKYRPDAQPEHREPLVRHVEHTLGLNRFMVRLARDARARGWLLAEWRNEAESTCRFTDGAGRPAWIRPDGSGLLDTDEASVPFLVEYDRGTLDGGDYQGKLEGYRRYYAREAWRMAFAAEPTLLFVCADDRAERRVSDAVRAAALDIPLLVTAEWRFTHDPATPQGALGCMWHDPSGAGGRQAFIPQDSESIGGSTTRDAGGEESGERHRRTRGGGQRDTSSSRSQQKEPS